MSIDHRDAIGPGKLFADQDDLNRFIVWARRERKKSVYEMAVHFGAEPHEIRVWSSDGLREMGLPADTFALPAPSGPKLVSKRAGVFKNTSERNKYLVKLRDAGWKYREIGEDLNMSAACVWSNYQRGLRDIASQERKDEKKKKFGRLLAEFFVPRSRINACEVSDPPRGVWVTFDFVAQIEDGGGR
tara:strand:+ start:227 stop:787 length:561 start_codon:yes stop_codon:yes gene_type:complete